MVMILFLLNHIKVYRITLSVRLNSLNPSLQLTAKFAISVNHNQNFRPTAKISDLLPKFCCGPLFSIIMRNGTFSVETYSSLLYNFLSKVEFPQPLPPTDSQICNLGEPQPKFQAQCQNFRPTAEILPWAPCLNYNEILSNGIKQSSSREVFP